MKVNGLTLSGVPHFNNDKEIVMAAVMENGFALEYASDELHNDEQVVMGAVKNRYDSIQYAYSFRNSGDFILKCIQEMGAEFLGELSWWNAAVSRKLRDDFDFMVRAVKLDLDCLQYASDRLKSVPEFNKIVSRFARKN